MIQRRTFHKDWAYGIALSAMLLQILLPLGQGVALSSMAAQPWMIICTSHGVLTWVDRSGMGDPNPVPLGPQRQGNGLGSACPICLALQTTIGLGAIADAGINSPPVIAQRAGPPPPDDRHIARKNPYGTPQVRAPPLQSA